MIHNRARQTATPNCKQRGDKHNSSRWGSKQMEIAETAAKNSEMLIELTADVVAAYVSNNPVPAGELPNLIADVHAALGRVGGGAGAASCRQAEAGSQPEEVGP